MIEDVCYRCAKGPSPERRACLEAGRHSPAGPALPHHELLVRRCADCGFLVVDVAARR